MLPIMDSGAGVPLSTCIHRMGRRVVLDGREEKVDRPRPKQPTQGSASRNKERKIQTQLEERARILLSVEALREYLCSNVALMRIMIARSYNDAHAQARRIRAREVDAEYAAVPDGAGTSAARLARIPIATKCLEIAAANIDTLSNQLNHYLNFDQFNSFEEQDRVVIVEKEVRALAAV